MLSSLAWTGAAKWAVQALSWTSTIVVVHLLTPSDYGLVGMAGVFLALLQPICDFGIASAIVQGRHLTSDQIARLNGLALLLGFACMLATGALAFPASAFFREPALLGAVPVMGLGFLVNSFRVVPTGLLVRDMGFRRLAFIETTEALLLLVTSLSLALTGFGYWALIIAPVVSKAAGATLAVRARPHKIAAPWPIARISGTVQFGAWVTVSSVAWYAYSNVDQLVVGRLLGDVALGAYAVGFTLASVPVEKISQLYQRVASSVISQVQHEPASVARYLMRISEGVALFSFPLSIGLALVADLFVEVALGPQWSLAIAPLRLLAAAAAFRSLDPLLAQILVATGHAQQNARSMLVAAMILPGAFFAAATWWGLAGVAAVWLIGHPMIVMTQQLRHALRVADARFVDYLRAVWPAVSGTAIMAAVVIGVRSVLDDRMPTVITLIASIVAGAISYAAALALLHAERLRAARAFVRPKRA